MATTIPRALKPFTGGEPLTFWAATQMHDAYASAQRDADVCTDPEDSNYYQGQVDALVDALENFGVLAPRPDDRTRANAPERNRP